MSNRNTGGNSPERQFERIAFLAPKIAACFFLIIVALYSWNFWGGFGDQATFGAFGDFIGGVLNPFLTFLTVLLLIYSIRFQIDELRHTRTEIERSHKEMQQANDIQTANVTNQANVFKTERVIAEIEVTQKEVERIFNTVILHQGNVEKTFLQYCSRDISPFKMLNNRNSSHKFRLCLADLCLLARLLFLLIEDANHSKIESRTYRMLGTSLILKFNVVEEVLEYILSQKDLIEDEDLKHTLVDTSDILATLYSKLTSLLDSKTPSPD
jgi:hypothetical protein